MHLGHALSRRSMLALCLLLVFLGGCAQAWVTPTAPASEAVALPLRPSPTPRPEITPIVVPKLVEKAGPTPTLALAPLSVGDGVVQYWSDPNYISAILHHGDHVWAATGGGVVRWTVAGEYRLYTLADGLPSQAVRGIAQDREGHIWVGFTDWPGWAEFDGDTWHSYDTRREAVETRYDALLQARSYDQRLWASRPESTWVWLPTPEGALEAYDGERWRSYNEHSGVSRHTWLVDITDQGRVWAIGQGVSTAEEGERWWEDHTFFTEIADRSHVTDLALAPDGALWLAFEGPPEKSGGVTRLSLDGDGPRWEGHLPMLAEAIPDQVYGVKLDQESTIWLCGTGGISFHRRGAPWRQIVTDGVDVRDWAWDEAGGLWLATRRGLWSIEPDGQTLHGPWLVPSPIIGSAVVGLTLGPAGRLWVATRDGVSSIASGTETRAELVEAIYCLERDPEGQIWAGGVGGLYLLSGGQASRQISPQPVTALAFDAGGSIYGCTDRGLLLRIDPIDGSTELLGDLQALAGAMPRDLAVDSQGTVWFATELGLGSLTAEGVFELATAEDRLLSSDVRAVAVGPDDLIWVATAMGLARRRPDGRWTRFTTQSTEGGLRSMEMWNLSAAPDGLLWMATADGISLREPENADWSYYDVPNARHVLAGGEGGIWVGTRSGLYRVRRDSLTEIE